jgi:hypothetical protein
VTVDAAGTEDIVLGLRRTLFQPLDEEINGRWNKLYEMLRANNPTAHEEDIARAASALVWQGLR